MNPINGMHTPWIQCDASSIHITMKITIITMLILNSYYNHHLYYDDDDDDDSQSLHIEVWSIGNAAPAIQGNVFTEGAPSASTKP